MEVIKNIEDITDAIHYKTKIKFEYWKYGITNKLEEIIVSTPKVSPYAIVYDKQEFYLIGIKEGQSDFYHYRLDRIRNLEVLTEKIEIEKSKRQIQAFAESTVEMFGGKKEEVEADINNMLLDTVLNQFGRNITIIKKNENEFKMLVNTNPKGFKMWAMRNIDLVEIIKPDSLRNEMKDIINKAKEKYKE